MGLLPSLFYEMEHDDFYLMLEGWVEEKEYQESLIRLHAAIIISQCSTGKKPASIDKLWPRDKKRSGVSERNRKILEQKKIEDTTEKIREIEATKRALGKLKKNGITGKNRG
jgi:hypothetical protein